MNKIIKMEFNQYLELKENKNFIIEIQGGKIYTWKDYITQIEIKLRFPTSCIDSMDRYLDWMMDLSWIENREITIVIKNSEKFSENNLELFEEIINDFKVSILPFWKYEAERVIVDGEKRNINVYLIN
ncbi:MAG: hypothetical protein RR620_04130 [Clostridium sp.]